MSIIEFRSTTKVYHGRRVVDDLSLTIEPGERIVLFGPSGCGARGMVMLAGARH